MRLHPPAPSIFLIGSLVALTWTSTPARAGSVVGNADTAGAGGVTRPNIRATAAVLTAPAILPLVASYQLQVGGRAGPDKLLGARAYAYDSNTGPVALGLGYHYDHAVPVTSDADLPGWVLPGDDLSNELGRTVFGGGLATSFADRRFGLGLSLLWHNRATRYTEVESWFEGGVSVAGRVGEEDQLILVATADNLLDPDRADTPLTFGGGAAYRPVPAFALLGELDVQTGSFDGPAELGFGTGAEVVAAEVVAIRGGFRRDLERDSDLVTAGLGARSEDIAVDYAAELVVGHSGATPPGWEDDKLRHYHSLSLTLSF